MTELALILLAALCIRAARNLQLPEADPEDGLHRPSAGPPRTMGALIAWSGSVRRAP
jgi:hypothetical protein